MLQDDLGYGDISVYPSPLQAARRILTPNVDKLAAEGIRFTDAYAGYSVCAPSRRTLMTGYHVGHFAPNNGGGGMLSNSSVTVAKLLQVRNAWPSPFSLCQGLRENNRRFTKTGSGQTKGKLSQIEGGRYYLKGY